jgi:hypothetical protein
MTRNFENAIKQIIHEKEKWNVDETIILKCEPYLEGYIVSAYIPSLDRKEGVKTFKVGVAETLMHMN